MRDKKIVGTELVSEVIDEEFDRRTGHGCSSGSVAGGDVEGRWKAGRRRLMQGVRRHVVVCINNTVIDDVTKKFSGIEELAGNARIEVVILSKALGESWEL